MTTVVLRQLLKDIRVLKDNISFLWIITWLSCYWTLDVLRNNQNRMWKNTASSFGHQVSASAVYPSPSLQAKTQHRWMQCFSIGCGRDKRLLLVVFSSFNRLCVWAVFTFGVVVEKTVVSAGFGVSLPERRSTEAKRRELNLSLRESLLQLSLQSLDEPPKETRSFSCHVQFVGLRPKRTF